MADSIDTLNPSASHSAVARAVSDFEKITTCVQAYFSTSGDFLERADDDDFAGRVLALEGIAAERVITAPCESPADIDAKVTVLRTMLAQDLELGSALDGRSMRLMDAIKADMAKLCHSQEFKLAA